MPLFLGSNQIDIFAAADAPTTVDAIWGYVKGNIGEQRDLTKALSEKADISAVPLSVSQLENDSGYLTQHQQVTPVAVSGSKIAEIGGISLYAPSYDLTPYALKANIGISYSTSDKKIKLNADGNVTEVDATDFIKDGMISSVTYDEATHTVHIVWNTDAGGKTTDICLSGLIDTYTAGNGIQLTNGQFSIDQSERSQFAESKQYVGVLSSLTIPQIVSKIEQLDDELDGVGEMIDAL